MALPVQDIDSIEVAFHLSCYLRDDDDAWVAGCPALDVVTQADSQEAAKTALEEAVEMWVESCLERETLGEALRELGWHRVDRTLSRGSRAVMMPPETGAEALGEPLELTLRIPAYRIDHLLGAEERAAGYLAGAEEGRPPARFHRRSSARQPRDDGTGGNGAPGRHSKAAGAPPGRAAQQPEDDEDRPRRATPPARRDLTI